MKLLKKSFFKRDTLEAAKALLGCVLVKKNSDGTVSKGIIVETEAYMQDDPACHAHRGRTKRSETLFKEGGITYVYFTYGMYHCLNLVANDGTKAGGVLIRALEPLENLENSNGPGKLCRELGITRTEHNETPVCEKNSVITVYEGEKIPEENVVTTTRIGIKLAADYPWRFYVKDSKYVSKYAAKKRP